MALPLGWGLNNRCAIDAVNQLSRPIVHDTAHFGRAPSIEQPKAESCLPFVKTTR